MERAAYHAGGDFRYIKNTITCEQAIQMCNNILYHLDDKDKEIIIKELSLYI